MGKKYRQMTLPVLSQDPFGNKLLSFQRLSQVNLTLVCVRLCLSNIYLYSLHAKVQLSEIMNK